SAAAYPDNRIIFRNDLPNYMPNGAADNFVVAAGGFAGAPGLPVLFDDNSGTDDDRNYVWIDKDRNVVGRLSWIETEVVIDSCDGNGEYSQSGSSPCYCPAWTGSGPGTRCREISVYLEYPFRWVSGAVVQQATRLEIIPLKTIVGRLL
ncbi:MAG: hypothetical protein HOC72_24475, partial [Rhodospirillaceae bacterium]|nr:hypothetical protein [Rhodospirillaceae bacterium]